VRRKPFHQIQKVKQDGNHATRKILKDQLKGASLAVICTMQLWGAATMKLEEAERRAWLVGVLAPKTGSQSFSYSMEFL
jgi:hypothetical protein